MSQFATAVSRLGAVLESSKASGAPDSQAGQLEILHEIQVQLRLAPPDDIKEAQSKLETNLTTALLQVRASLARRARARIAPRSSAQSSSSALMSPPRVLLDLSPTP